MNLVEICGCVAAGLFLLLGLVCVLAGTPDDDDYVDGGVAELAAWLREHRDELT